MDVEAAWDMGDVTTLTMIDDLSTVRCAQAIDA